MVLTPLKRGCINPPSPRERRKYEPLKIETMKRYRVQSYRRIYTFDTLQAAKEYAQRVFSKSGVVVAITEVP